MKHLLAIGIGALVLAAPAGADPGYATHTIVRFASGHGTVGRVPFSFAKTRVAYGSFHSTRVRATLWALNAVKLRGTGIVNGRAVVFTAVGVQNVLPGVDVFRVAWNHGASFGGRVTTGGVFIR